MPLHPALQPGRVAVDHRRGERHRPRRRRSFAALGMKVVLADANAAALEAAEARLHGGRRAEGRVRLCARRRQPTLQDVERLRDLAYEAFGEVAVLMNNAGIGGGGGVLGDLDQVAPADRRQPLGRHPRRQRLRAGDDRAGDARGDRQHRLEAGHHLPAGRHRLQRVEGGREGRDRGARPRTAQHRGLPGQRASADPRLHLHRA